MRVLDDLAAFEPQDGPAAVAVGNFDGVHLGHRAIFELARGEAARLGGPTVALTFDPHPARVLVPDRAPPLIQPMASRLRRIALQGVDVAVVQRFDRALAALTAREFVAEVLVRRLAAGAVVLGHDFRFGRGRAGDEATLAALGADLGFTVHVAKAVRVGEVVVSSTEIRRAVAAGDLDLATRLLGRPFVLEGVVEPGAGRGRSIGVPTANLRPDGELRPRLGVYAAQASWEGGAAPAVVNVGRAPTFGPREVLIEAHLLDVDVDLPGIRLTLELLTCLREERRFSGPDELVAQIGRDIARARELLGA